MQTELAYTRARTGLETLKMSAALDSLDNVLETARLDSLVPVEVLDRLLEIEVLARHDRRVEANLRFAGLPFKKRLEEFEFEAQPSIDPALIGRIDSGYHPQ